ncbi:MAG TPA: acyl carrier protein [Candidatus Angelobacter sp.]|nr:acyl carrier protein [Candidatus Angelobacter sp.]
MNDIKNQLRSIIVQALHLNQSPETIPETNLTSALGFDSINSLELLIWVENHFKISINDEDLSVALIDSLDVLAAYVERQLSLSESVGAGVGGEA